MRQRIASSQEIYTPVYLTLDYAGMNSSAMEPVPDILAVVRQIKAKGRFNQSKLAKKLHVTQPTVSRWLKGVLPEIENVQAIIELARDLGIASPHGEEELQADAETQSREPMVRVVGYVGAGAEAHFYAVSQGDLDEVEGPGNATSDTVAVEIKGTSAGIWYDRWLVFYDDVRRPVTQDLVNGPLPCVVGLANGQVLLKKIKRGSRPGRFNLVAADGDLIEDAQIEWAAKVKAMRPR